MTCLFQFSWRRCMPLSLLHGMCWGIPWNCPFPWQISCGCCRCADVQWRVVKHVAVTLTQSIFVVCTSIPCSTALCCAVSRLLSVLHVVAAAHKHFTLTQSLEPPKCITVSGRLSPPFRVRVQISRSRTYWGFSLAAPGSCLSTLHVRIRTYTYIHAGKYEITSTWIY